MSQPFTHRSIYYGWLPTNPEVHRAFLDKHVLGVTLNAPADWNGWAKKFIATIKASTTMKPLLDLTFKQVNKEEKWAASDEKYRVRNVDHLEAALTSVTQGAPEAYVVVNDKGDKIGEPIGVPIYLILDLLSNTGAAYDLFRLPEFNTELKTFLNDWGTYLASTTQYPDPTRNSNYTLNQTDLGWFGSYALGVLEQGLQGQTFEETYGVDPAQAQESYKSWDQFFCRPFKDIDRVRPVTSVPRFPAIYNACESTSLRTAHNVQLDDTFWLKSQKYSLYDMFGGDPDITEGSLSAYADRFVGGSVYQAFLGPQDYHRYHSPIGGTVLEAVVLPGTYYAVLPDEGAPADDQDLQPGDPHGAMIRSQPWLSVAAARGIIIIQPEDSSPMELVAFIPIGMVEVSTVKLDVGKDSTVTIGQQLGMFRFGGSSYVLVVKPKQGYKVSFEDVNDIPITPNQHRWVRSIIGRVVKE